MMAVRDRTLADRRPHAPRDRLQAKAMLVRGEALDLFAWVLRGFFGNGVRELFFNAAAFFGRGRFRVLWAWLLDRPADRLQCLPSPLRRDRFEVEFGRHPICHL